MRDKKVLVVSVWFFAFMLNLGFHSSDWKAHFTGRCRVCGLGLVVNSRTQDVFYHSPCRYFRNAKIINNTVLKYKNNMITIDMLRKKVARKYGLGGKMAQLKS